MHPARARQVWSVGDPTLLGGLSLWGLELAICGWIRVEPLSHRWGRGSVTNQDLQRNRPTPTRGVPSCTR
eukprot:7494317-Pyramimonas_sp.AAC.1